jgi:osmotically-inducible protein OsmY
MLPRERYVPTAPVAGGAVGILALGAGLMFFFDPTRGRSRRAWIAQKTGRYVRETGEFFGRTGRHLRNKAVGSYYQGRRAVGEYLPDWQLAEHVRSALGQIGIGTGSIAIEACEGCVTLTGRCTPEDVDRVIGSVREVPGVSDVRNQMSVEDRVA